MHLKSMLSLTSIDISISKLENEGPELPLIVHHHFQRQWVSTDFPSMNLLPIEFIRFLGQHLAQCPFVFLQGLGHAVPVHIQ